MAWVNMGTAAFRLVLIFHGILLLDLILLDRVSYGLRFALLLVCGGLDVLCAFS